MLGCVLRQYTQSHVHGVIRATRGRSIHGKAPSRTLCVASLFVGRLAVGGLWCPNCGSEYRPGFVECADCTVPLAAVKPPTQPDIT